jgi:DNA-binding transcriptional LysR family regulator
MKLSQMRYFSASCHAGNISKAAAELHISQPSITASIKALEDELGLALLHRSNRAVSPTPDGERFLIRCDAILAEVDSLSEDFAEISRKHKVIHVGIPPMIGSILFPEIFHSFRKKHPEIRINPVEIGSQAAKEAVANSDLDIAVITMGDELPARLDALRLTAYEMMYCVGPQHPLAEKKTVSLKETADYPMILFSGGYYQQALLTSKFRELDIQPDVLFHSNQLTTIKSFIRENIASGFIMPQIVHAEDGIIPIPVEEGLRLNVAVVWRKDDYLTKEAKSFISFCRKTFESKT